MSSNKAIFSRPVPFYKTQLYRKNCLLFAACLPNRSNVRLFVHPASALTRRSECFRSHDCPFPLVPIH